MLPNFPGNGGQFGNLETVTKIPRSTLSQLVPEVCEVIYKNLQPKYLKFPSTEMEWIAIAKAFQQHTNYPLCLGKFLRNCPSQG